MAVYVTMPPRRLTLALMCVIYLTPVSSGLLLTIPVQPYLTSQSRTAGFHTVQYRSPYHTVLVMQVLNKRRNNSAIRTMAEVVTPTTLIREVVQVPATLS